jgi:hypothetical protein
VIAVRFNRFPEDTLAKAEYVFENLAEITRELDSIDEYCKGE